MKWSDLVEAEPRLAELGEQRLVGPGVVLVGTIRRDGSPRISPVEPLLWRGDLWLSMMLGSYKAIDLRRDPRVLVHSVVTDRNGALGEFKVRGIAREETVADIQRGYAEQVRDRIGWDPVPGEFHLFTVDIHDLCFIRYVESSGDQFVVRWPARQEYVRRGKTATTLGEAEPYRELLGGVTDSNYRPTD
jgi:hypothetical protein